MSLPPGVVTGPGRRLPVSQRGYFTRFPDGTVHFTACMFAGLAQILERRGFRLPLGRQRPAPNQADNFVHQLQVAGDPTPANGSTIAQSQAALRKLFGTTPTGVQFGTMSAPEIAAELAKGATIRVSVDCSKLPRALKRWVGYSYTGRHAITLDDARSLDNGAIAVALTDPMYRPAKAIMAVWVALADLDAALVRTAKGIVVTLGYQADPPAPPAPPAPAETDAQRAARIQNLLDTELAKNQILLQANQTVAGERNAEHEQRLAQAERSQQLIADVEAAIDRYSAPMEEGS